MALTDKQVKFIDEYMIDMNATAAYGRAGYTAEGNSAEASASRLLRNVKIQEEIAKRQQEMQEKTGITAKWVLDNLKYVAERCMAPEPMVDKEGNVIEWRFDSSGANKALETIGKHLGMFKEEVKISGSISIESMLENI